MLTYTYYGHACFLLDDGTSKVLVDPFLTGNPQASITDKDVEADYILITHAHGDHIGDAPNIAVRTGATVVIDFGGQRVKTIGMNLGGTVKTDFGFVRMVPALHSSGIGGGIACGYVIAIGGKVVYFAGDTALFSDMKLIGERDKIDYAILPLGGHSTMAPADAAKAVAFLDAANAIPLHYNTWDVIKQDAEDLVKLVEFAKVHIVKPGQSIELA